MSAISYSVPTSTEKDELDDVSDDEKEGILDDMYGREEVSDDEEEMDGEEDGNNNNYYEQEENVDDEFDITDELLEQFNDCLATTPVDEKREYMEALEKAPAIVLEEESNPIRFLRAEEYDVSMAVLRLVEYWKLRVEVFQEKAFEPITIQGAMNDEVDAILKYPLSVFLLPNDRHGRTVFCLDVTNVRFEQGNFNDQLSMLKKLWFVVHVALQRRSTQLKGFVWLIIDQSSAWRFPSKKLVKLFSRSRDECFPIKIRCIHICSSALFVKIFVPVVKYFMSLETRQRLQLHSSVKKPAIIAALETFGLWRDNLPASIGGNFKTLPTWIDDCNHIANGRSRRRVRRMKRERSTGPYYNR